MDIAAMFWELLINPNIAYLLLIIGLWALVMAFVSPGTGVSEVVATISLALAIMGLARLDVNAAGVIMIAIAMLMLIFDLKVQSHGVLTIGGVITLAIGSIFLFRIKEDQMTLSPWVIALTSLSSAVFFGVALTAAMRVQKNPPVIDPRAVIGQFGEVRAQLDPVGTVQLNSELWSAKSEIDGEMIANGTKIIVTELEGLTLKVKKAA